VVALFVAAQHFLEGGFLVVFLDLACDAEQLLLERDEVDVGRVFVFFDLVCHQTCWVKGVTQENY
jgi:hypothetical protein